MPEETREIRRKRLAMRSMRRGMKEMDILLIRFSDNHLASFGDDELDLYDDLLSENDQDLYQWVSGQADAPDRFAQMIFEIGKNSVKQSSNI